MEVDDYRNAMGSNAFREISLESLSVASTSVIGHREVGNDAE